MQILTAIRSFVAALLHRKMADQFAMILAGESAPERQTEPSTPPTSAKRSEALTLLSALQREARFVDFVMESLEGASDEQIGAVVRDVHRDCGAVLERLFSLRPLVQQAEGADVDVPANFDAGRFRLTGNVHGEPPFRGKLGHHGWQATRSEVPKWSGNLDNASVISPADVEL